MLVYLLLDQMLALLLWLIFEIFVLDGFNEEKYTKCKIVCHSKAGTKDSYA